MHNIRPMNYERFFDIKSSTDQPFYTNNTSNEYEFGRWLLNLINLVKCFVCIAKSFTCHLFHSVQILSYNVYMRMG